jgi:iron complex outermembrane receptor protein
MRDRLLASTIIAGAALLASPAVAQAPADSSTQTVATAATSDSSAPSGDIVVTGSRIPQPNLTSASPVTVINSQDIKLTGTTRIEDLINQLPQAFGDQGGNISNGSTGTSTVNLRNLGSDRTLVLINGRRLVPGDPSSSSADLNFIPSQLVKRVDVLTGGASATYGADAVGGVVNFIMDSDFTGFRVDSQYSLYQHNNDTNVSGIRDALNKAGYGFPNGNSANGGTIDANAMMGGSFDDDRGHIVAYVGYRREQAVLQSSRDYSSCGFSGSTANSKVKACSGSATSNNFILYDPALGTSTFYQLGNGRTLVPGENTYNFGPTNYYQRPDERYTAGFFAHYDVSDAFKPYMEGMFMDDHTRAQIASSGDFGNTTSINCDNPLLSAQQAGIVCDAPNLIGTGFNNQGVLLTNAVGILANQGATGITTSTFTDPSTGKQYNQGFLQILKRNTEGGPRIADFQHVSYRLVVGAKGDIAKGISYDAYYQYGRTNYNQTYLNDVSVSRLKNALDVVSVNGVNECRSVETGTDPNCKVYDIFAPGQITQAALNYIQAPGFQRAQVSEQVASASITALLGEYGFKSPLADDGVALNVGAEYRRESLNLQTDLEFSTGDLAGQGGASPPVSGAFDVKEGFVELRAPLIHENGIYDLTFDGGYRYSSYGVAGNTTNTSTYKGEIDFSPIKDITFRGSYNRAVRSPNIQELFSPQTVTLDGSTDPCAGRKLTAADTGCLAQGLSVGQNVVSNPASQYNGLTGGSPNLKPETADTFTLGLVLQPRFIRGLSITVDAFSIKVKDTIQAIGEDTILATRTGEPSSSLCGLIHRDQTGSLWRTPQGFVTDLQTNIGSVKTRGIDVGGNYSRQLGGHGSLGVEFTGTYLDQFKTDNGVSTPYDCAGFYGTQCGTPAPKWRHRARVTYTAPDGIGLSFQWRYFGSVKVDKSSSNPTLAASFPLIDAKIPSQSYFDLTATARIGDHYSFRLGVQNIMDKQPPLISQANLSAVFGNGNTYPNVYDALGRYIFAGITLDL